MTDGWKRLWTPPRHGRPTHFYIDGEYSEKMTTKATQYAARSMARFAKRTDAQNEKDNIFHGNINVNEIGSAESVRFIKYGLQ